MRLGKLIHRVNRVHGWRFLPHILLEWCTRHALKALQTVHSLLRVPTTERLKKSSVVRLRKRLHVCSAMRVGRIAEPWCARGLVLALLLRFGQLSGPVLALLAHAKDAGRVGDFWFRSLQRASEF